MRSRRPPCLDSPLTAAELVRSSCPAGFPPSVPTSAIPAPGPSARTAPIGPRTLDRVARDHPHDLARSRTARAPGLASARRMHGPPMAQRVEGHVHLAAALAAVATMPRPALATRPQGRHVHDHGAGLTLPAGGETDHPARVHHHGLEAAGIEPAAASLADRLPGPDVAGQQSPRGNPPARSIARHRRPPAGCARAMGRPGSSGPGKAQRRSAPPH